MEPFQSHLGVRWEFQDDLGIYYPVDKRAGPGEQNRFRVPADPTEGREGYCMIALLPNLSGAGKVLIVAGTGGSAVGTAGDFLVDESSVARLRSMLPAGKDTEFPYFEALIQIKSRSSLPKDVTVVLCRALRE